MQNSQDKKGMTALGAAATGAVFGAAAAVILSNKDTRDKIKKTATKLSQDFGKNFSETTKSLKDKSEATVETMSDEFEESKDSVKDLR